MSARAETDWDPETSPFPKPGPSLELDPIEVDRRERASIALAAVAVLGVFAGTSAAGQLISRALDHLGTVESTRFGGMWLVIACIAGVLALGLRWALPRATQKDEPRPAIATVAARGIAVLLLLSLPAIWYFGQALYASLAQGARFQALDVYSTVVVGLVALAFVGLGLVWSLYGRIEVCD